MENETPHGMGASEQGDGDPRPQGEPTETADTPGGTNEAETIGEHDKD